MCQPIFKILHPIAPSSKHLTWHCGTHSSDIAIDIYSLRCRQAAAGEKCSNDAHPPIAGCTVIVQTKQKWSLVRATFVCSLCIHCGNGRCPTRYYIFDASAEGQHVKITRTSTERCPDVRIICVEIIYEIVVLLVKTVSVDIIIKVIPIPVVDAPQIMKVCRVKLHAG
jgi:hypothetical protein